VRELASTFPAEPGDAYESITFECAEYPCIGRGCQALGDAGDRYVAFFFVARGECRGRFSQPAQAQRLKARGVLRDKNTHVHR
jgi:hypothetical protein